MGNVEYGSVTYNNRTFLMCLSNDFSTQRVGTTYYIV